MSSFDDESEVLQWRQQRAERLRANERSWLNLAALYWLKEGDNTFGSAPNLNFILPSGAPARAGVFNFIHDQVTLIAEPGIEITCNGDVLPARPLLDDQQAQPDYLYLGRFILVVIRRGTATLIRLWDTEHPGRKAFSGLNFFPYNPQYRLVAQYSGYAPYKLVKQKDIIGEVSDRQMLGYLTFSLGGKQYRLDAEEGDDGLFIAFRDQTNADTTYAGGRYLLTGRPQDGQVVLDFNKATNMPCAYTVYATCGLPTQDNRLPIPIEAGEQIYQKYH